MKKQILLLLVTFQVFAQTKQITIDEIWNGTFQPEYLYGLKALPKSDYYSKIDYVQNFYELNIYDYPTQKKITTAFSTASYPHIGYFEYTFSPDEQQILIGTNIHSIYRHSRKGIYYVYNRKTQQLEKISDDFIQEPSFSPQGNQVAFIKNNNIYVKNLDTQKILQITNDGKKNHIINGIPDWVYEEEFGYSKAYKWSEDGKMLAFVKFDESEVPEYSMIIYNDNLYPQIETFKYPKAGEKNSKVSLHYYQFENQKTYQVNLGKYEYLPRIYWTKMNYLMAITLNRHQNHLKLHLYSPIVKQSIVILEEKDNKYIDMEAIDNLTFLNNGSFIWTSEKNGYNHLYLYNIKGQLKKQITSGNWEVTQVFGIDKKRKTIYYQSTETGSINRAVYSINFYGQNKKLLTPSKGTSQAQFSSNFKYFINTYSSAKIPYTFTVNDASTGKIIKTIIDNKKLLEKLKTYNLPQKVFVSFKGADGTDLNGYIIEPTVKKDKYPVLIYQYSGPNVQTVRNTWHRYNDYFHYLLAQQGYMIISVDPRGTGGKGADFKKATYKQLGKLELEDITTVARQWGSNSFIDENRIGIWGWSFGGYVSANAILKKPEVFKMAIAIAPVTNWRFYDTIYTERYMQTPEENSNGYDENSPLFFTDNLQGAFLLVHGSADDNVHLQNSMLLAKKLQENDKSFDEMIYTDKNHGIYGKKTRHHLYKKMLKFIRENL